MLWFQHLSPPSDEGGGTAFAKEPFIKQKVLSLEFSRDRTENQNSCGTTQVDTFLKYPP